MNNKPIYLGNWAQYGRLGMHVSESNRAVVKAAHKMIKKRSRRSVVDRHARHQWLREMLACHAHARQEYTDVMRGSW